MARGVSVSGGTGDDVLSGGAGNDFLYGKEGNDDLYGGGGDDQMQGGSGNDRLFGGAGRDSLYGQEGSDLLDGGEGDDQLFAGGIVGGGDTLVGGDGSDVFALVAGTWGTDLIADFQRGLDRIDLSRIDADERTSPGIITGKKTPGNEAFQIVGTTDGVTPGVLVIGYGIDEQGRAITIVSGYTDTVAGPDFELHLLGTHALSASDFIL